MTDEDPRFYTNVNDIPWFRKAVEDAQYRQLGHNHVTREMKPAESGCPACDRYWMKSAMREVISLRNVIYGTLETAELDGHEFAFRYLTQEAQGRNISKYEDYI